MSAVPASAISGQVPRPGHPHPEPRRGQQQRHRRHAQPGDLDAAESDLAALRDQVAGRVALAAFPSAAASFVPAAWATLAGSAP